MEKSGKKKIPVLIILVLLLGVFADSLSAFSQTVDEILYPTLITARYTDGSVTVNFESIKGEGLQYKIYRSKNPIKNDEDLQNALMVAEITGENLPFRDNPETDGNYYYAITVIREEKEYTELVPFQNITVRPIDYSPIPEPVENITVSSPENHLVTISFSPINEDYTYKLYVSAQRISDIADMDTFSVLSKNGDYFKLKIQEEEPYYFFVSTSNRLGMENKTVIAGTNATAQALIKKKPQEKPPEIKKKKKPVVVSVSKLIEDNLRNNFYNGRYTTALKVFQKILKKHKLSASQRGTAHFYMGQCYYYQRKYKNAVRYFILSKEIHFFENKADLWIDRCLEMVD